MAQILTLNAGSSSIKFALFSPQDEIGGVELEEWARGQIEGLGAIPRLHIKDGTGTVLAEREYGHAEIADHHAALGEILGFIERHFPDAKITTIGHRVVHGGMNHSRPLVVTSDAIADLERLVQLAPLHQPHNISGIQAAQACFPAAMQIACFDTAFHRTHAWVNDTFALPRAYYDEGIRRYGFHGLSYEYISEEMGKQAPALAKGRMIVAHLGNGASLCGIRDGRSVDSTMGFTALDGLPMGTRGQLDPGVVLYLWEEKGMSAAEVTALLYQHSGLKGLSGISHDMRELEGSDRAEARQAIDYFVTRIRREIGAMAAQIGGLDVLVFSAGIGEHSPHVREAVAQGLEWLGIELDVERNRKAEAVVSTARSRVPVFVLATDEEAMIARHSLRCRAGVKP